MTVLLDACCRIPAARYQDSIAYGALRLWHRGRLSAAQGVLCAVWCAGAASRASVAHETLPSGNVPGRSHTGMCLASMNTFLCAATSPAASSPFALLLYLWGTSPAGRLFCCLPRKQTADRASWYVHTAGSSRLCPVSSVHSCECMRVTATAACRLLPERGRPAKQGGHKGAPGVPGARAPLVRAPLWPHSAALPHRPLLAAVWRGGPSLRCDAAPLREAAPHQERRWGDADLAHACGCASPQRRRIMHAAAAQRCCRDSLEIQPAVSGPMLSVTQ